MVNSDEDTKVIPGETIAGRLHRSPTTLGTRFDLLPIGVIEDFFANRLGFHEIHVEPVFDGMGAMVFQVSSGRQRVTLKVGIYRNTSSPWEDCVYFTTLRHRADPVLYDVLPKSRLLDLSGEIVPYPCLVMDRLAGLSLLRRYEGSELRDRERDLAIVGETLARLHLAAPEGRGYGHLNHANVYASRLRSSEWELQGVDLAPQAYFQRERVRALNVLQKLQRLSNMDADACTQYINMATLSSPARSIHGDPSLRNFLFSADKLTGVIDGCGKLSWVEEDIASCCVFIIHAFSNTREPESLHTLLSPFITTYTSTWKEPLSIPLLRAFLVIKTLLRWKTSTDFGNPQGAWRMLQLLQDGSRALAQTLTLLPPGSVI